MIKNQGFLVILAAIGMLFVSALESFRATPWSPLFPVQLGIAGILFFLLVPHEKRSNLFRWNGRGFWEAMGLLLLASIILSFIGQFVFSVTLKLPVEHWDYMAYFKQIYPDMTAKFGMTGADILMILFLLILAPICEELFYRGVFWETFSGSSKFFAYMSSAAFFAMRHAFELTYFWPSYPTWVGIYYIVITFTSGLIFMRARDKTGSLLPGMVAHSSINLILVTLALLYFKNIIAL